MSARTEKKLEKIDNDVVSIEQKIKEYTEKLRQKKEKREETRDLAIVEIVRDMNISIGELKTILNNGGKLLDSVPPLVQTTEAVTSAAEKSNYRKEIENEEEID